MRVRGAGMRNVFAGMAMRVDMHPAVAVAVLVKVHAVAPQPPQHMRAETNQHDADGSFNRPREMFWERVPEQNRSAGKGEQRQGMAEAPGQAVLDDVADIAAARGDARYRRDVIGLECVLHAQQKSQPQNSKHLFPARLTPLS